MTSNPVYRIPCLFFLALLAAFSARATTIVMPTDEELIAKSPVVLSGTVESMAPVERNGAIWTETILNVDQVLKGTNPGPTATIREVGGKIGTDQTVIFGSPEYAVGERVLVFLWPTRRGDYQTMDLFVGKFTERFTLAGERLWYRNDEAPRTVLLNHNLERIDAVSVQRDASRFESFIRERAAGRAGDAGYGVANPDMMWSLSENFTMISEPTIYRWFTFDSGGSVVWKGEGTQPGYSDGGVSEAKTGMAAWTSYSSAKINYTWGGLTSASPGGLNVPNGINEVMFNDPLDEIAGSWTGSSGVVGQGGFNNVNGPRSWNSPFSADSSHPAQTWSAWNITEGNLTIQDGVSPARGISSSVLAEILAHEFGHTLGFGHSADGTALMYPSVSGRGASLRTDDQSAARWLYPNGNGGPLVPPAPSSLAASATSSTSVRLTWRDNASDETKQTIYYATGSGGFIRWGDVGANATSSNLTGLSPSQTYSFRVTASNSTGESGVSNTASVTLPGGTVTAAFSVSPSSGVAGVTRFSFTDQSTGSVVSRNWSFGDGSSSGSTNPTHIYNSPGTYSVTLTVYNGGSQQSSASHAVTVTSSGPALSAAFDLSSSSITEGQSIQFTDRSTGSPTSWLWTFGDGWTSTTQHPSHRFDSAGVFTVTLTVKNTQGQSTTSRNISVSSSPAVDPVNADFTLSTSTPGVNELVSFEDRSSGNPTSWRWSFGDGYTSSTRSPTHRYSRSGSFTVTLTASRSGSSSSASRTVVVDAPAQTFHGLIPVSTQVTGAGGTSWRTDLTIHNAGSFGVSVRVLFIPGYGGSAQSRTISLAAGRSISWQNILASLFGLADGAGALRIESDSASGIPDLRVASRTYTDGPDGTYGQFVESVPGESTPARLLLTGVEWSTRFRTNIGLVNRSSQFITTTLTLYASSGGVLGQTTLTLPPNSFQQQSAPSLFPILGSGSHSQMSIQLQSSSANAVTAYASIIDNVSQDPVYLSARGVETDHDLFVPAVGRTGGAEGTYWRSDVTLFNPGSSSISVTLRFLRAGQDNRFTGSRSIALGPHNTRTIQDVVTWLGGGENSGALELIWSGGSEGPLVSSRTYTTRNGDIGTLGQAIRASNSGETGSTSVIPGLSWNTAFRTNVGFVNAGDNPMTLTLTLLDSTGRALGVRTLGLLPRSQTQGSASQLFPGVNLAAAGAFTLRAQSSVPTLLAYGSVVDNHSGDPVFVSGQ